MKQALVFLLIFFSVIFSVVIVPLIDCGDSLPKGDYVDSGSDRINRVNHSELKQHLIDMGSDFKMSLHFWKFAEINQKTYLTVYGPSKGSRIYFHLLVKNMDENINKINIVEVMTCPPEMLFIVKGNDLLQAHDVLNKLCQS